MTTGPEPVLWHFARYAGHDGIAFDMEPWTYRPLAERDAANKLAAGWPATEVVTEPVPPHAFHPGMAGAEGRKCARCEQLAGHPLHS
jgi:hypothetical protein